MGRTRITGVWVNTALVNLLGELLAEMMLGHLIRVGVGTCKFHESIPVQCPVRLGGFSKFS